MRVYVCMCEGLARVSLQKSVITQEILHYSDIKLGAKVKVCMCVYVRVCVCVCVCEYMYIHVCMCVLYMCCMCVCTILMAFDIT